MIESARRAARARWEITIQRPPSEPAAHPPDAPDAVADDLYWLHVPRDARARLTWDLSCELYSLARRNGSVFDEDTNAFVDVESGDLERRLPRAAFVVTRR